MSVSALADTTDSISNKSYQLNGVEIVASKASVNHAPSPLQIISSESMASLGINSVSDAVKHFTGVAVKDYGGLGGLKTVSVRGFGAQHTTVSYDGVTISDAQAGQIDLGKLSLNNVSSITLSLGLENIFQPARNVASIALLNIETKSPMLSNKSYLGEVSMQTGSFGLFGSAFSYMQRVSKKIVLTANADGQSADGRFPFDQDTGDGIVTRKRINNDIEMYRGEANMYVNFSHSDELKAKIYYYDSNRGVPGPTILYNDYSTDRMKNRNGFGQLSYKKSFSTRFNYKVLAKYNHDYMMYSRTHYSYENGILVDEFKQNELYLSNILLYQASNNLSFSLAEDLSYTKLKNDGMTIAVMRNPTRKTSITNLAAKYENDRLVATANVYATISQDKVSVAEKDSYKRMSPSLSLSYALLDSKSLRLRASYRDVFRLPTITEEYYKRVGAPLKPEKVKQLNIGAIWTTQISETLDYLRFVVDAYHAKVRDKIIIKASTGLSETSNRGKVQMNGVDANTSITVRLKENVSLKIAGGYSFLSAIDITKSSDKFYKDQIIYTPVHSGSGSVVFDNPWINLGYSFIVSGERYYSPQNIEQYRLRGYSDHTLSVNKQFYLGETSLFLQADLRNIFNENYSIINSYPMPGRSFTVSAKLKF